MTPDECRDMAEIRAEIDNLDRQVISLLGRRFEYVKAAAKFKTSEESVRAPERFSSMLESRRAWAEESGLNPDVIEAMYRELVGYFVREELERWKHEA